MKLACSAINFAEIEFFVDRAAGKKRIRRVIFDAPVMFFSRRQSTEDIPAEYYQDNIKFVLYKKSFSINALTESLSEAKNLIRKKTRHVSRDELYDWNIGRKCGEKYFEKIVKLGLDNRLNLWYHTAKQGRNGSPPTPYRREVKAWKSALSKETIVIFSANKFPTSTQR